MLETLDAMMLCQLMLKMNIASIWGSTFILPFGLGLLASELSGSACLYPTMLGLYKHSISLHLSMLVVGIQIQLHRLAEQVLLSITASFICLK